MELKLSQFNILVYIENKQGMKLIQTHIAKACSTSVGTVNNVIAEFKKLELIEEGQRSIYKIKKKGYDCLEPYKVKRAILIAAGFGSRMIPVTLNTPKPLVRVHGQRLIEIMIDALLEKGIEEIHIVRGYLGEQFDELKLTYPSIKLYTNTKFRDENNISSAMLVKDLYENAYVMDADLYLKNKDLIRKYEFKSNYLGVQVDRTDDWRLLEKNQKVVGMTMGGINCHLMIGLSFWNQKDGQSFQSDISHLYEQPGGKGKYWDDVPLGEYNGHYDIYIRSCTSEDIVEIDTFDELKMIDPSYER